MSVAVVITGLTVVSFASLDEKAGEATEEAEEALVETGHGQVIVGVIAMLWG